MREYNVEDEDNLWKYEKSKAADSWYWCIRNPMISSSGLEVWSSLIVFMSFWIFSSSLLFVLIYIIVGPVLVLRVSFSFTGFTSAKQDKKRGSILFIIIIDDVGY